MVNEKARSGFCGIDIVGNGIAYFWEVVVQVILGYRDRIPFYDHAIPFYFGDHTLRYGANFILSSGSRSWGLVVVKLSGSVQNTFGVPRFSAKAFGIVLELI